LTWSLHFGDGLQTTNSRNNIASRTLAEMKIWWHWWHLVYGAIGGCKCVIIISL